MFGLLILLAVVVVGYEAEGYRRQRQHDAMLPAPRGPQLWLFDNRCGCAWTLDPPVTVRPCSRHTERLALRTWELEMPRDTRRLARKLGIRR